MESGMTSKGDRGRSHKVQESRLKCQKAQECSKGHRKVWENRAKVQEAQESGDMEHRKVQMSAKECRGLEMHKSVEGTNRQ